MKLPKDVMDTLRELVALIGEDVQEIEIERGWWGRGKIRISKVGAHAPVVQALSPLPTAGAVAESAQVAHAVPAASDESVELAEPAEPADDESGYHTLKSPMVGMFYCSPNPDSPPYVQEGDEIASGQTMCIIEAMKIMNEIEADIKGRVVRVLVDNAKPVEYNTPLFLIEPT